MKGVTLFCQETHTKKEAEFSRREIPCQFFSSLNILFGSDACHPHLKEESVLSTTTIKGRRKIAYV